MTATTMYSRVALNADGTRISGYMALWGTPDEVDCYGTWFDRSAMPDIGTNFLPIWLMYQHGYDPEIGPDIIGRVTEAGSDNIGVWFKAELDRNSPHYSRVINELKANQLATSTGADPFAEFDPDGRFKTWRVYELSLTPTPCEKRMPRVKLENRFLKVLPEDSLPDCGCDKSRVLTEPNTPTTTLMGDNRMDPQLLAQLQEALQPLIEQYGLDVVMQALQAGTATEPPATMSAEPAQNPVASLVAALSAQLQQTQVATTKSQPAPAPDLQAMINQAVRMAMATAPAVQQPPANPPATQRKSTPAVTDVVDLRFDHLTAREMAIVHEMTRAANKTANISDRFRTALMRKVGAEMRHGQHWASQAPFKRSVQTIAPFLSRADELVYTTQDGYGDQWIGVYYETDLIEKIRQDTALYRLMMSKGMVEKVVERGYESETVPVEGADPTWYVVGQATAMQATTLNIPQTKLPTSKVATAKMDVTLVKLGCAVPYTGEFEEDSLVAAAPTIRRQMDISGQEVLESIFINGDTTTGNAPSGNINAVDAAVAAGSLGDLPYYTAFDGILHRPLIDVTANSRSAGGSLSDADYRLLLGLLGTNGNAAAQREKLLYIVDNMTDIATMGLAINATADKRAVAATVDSGRVVNMWGVDYYVSGQMALANSAGKISSDTPANNIYGRIGLVRPDRGRVAWKRQVTTEVQRTPMADATTIVSFMRLGFEVVSDNDFAAATYYVGVNS